MSILKRYINMHENGGDSYFDVDEIIELLDYFEENDSPKHYKNVLALGVKLHPKNSVIQARVCKTYIDREEYVKALELIEQIDDEKDRALNLLKMECLTGLNRYHEVVALIEKKQALTNSQLEELFEQLAPALSEMNHEKEAYDLVKRGLLVFPDNLILKEELCYHLEVRGKVAEAIEVCNELIERNPYSTDYWYMLGRIYSISGEYDKAVDAYDFALTCDDADTEIKLLKGYCLFMNESYEKAIELYREILSEEEGFKEHIQPLLAESYMRSEHFEQAYLLFKEIIEKSDPKQLLTLYNNLIRCCIETERDKEALEIRQIIEKIIHENNSAEMTPREEIKPFNAHEETSFLINQSPTLSDHTKQNSALPHEKFIHSSEILRCYQSEIPATQLARHYIEMRHLKN